MLSSNMVAWQTPQSRCNELQYTINARKKNNAHSRSARPTTPATWKKGKNLTFHSLHGLITDDFIHLTKKLLSLGIHLEQGTLSRDTSIKFTSSNLNPLRFISLFCPSTHQFHKLYLLKICICHLFTTAHYILCKINLLNIPHILPDIPFLHTVNISLTSNKLNQAPSATASCTLNQYSNGCPISPSCGSQSFPVHRLIKQQSVFCGLIACLTLYITNNCLQIQLLLTCLTGYFRIQKLSRSIVLKLNRYHNHSKQTSAITNCREGHIKNINCQKLLTGI